MRSLVRCYVREQGFEDDTVDKVVLAIDEACANAIRHAYQGETTGVVDVMLGVEDDSLVIEVRDEGLPAPCERVGKRLGEPPANPEDIKPGGLGIPFMHAVFDSVEFESGESKGNRVRLRLQRPVDGSK